jgi:predicted transcriptional regulator/DNA-binding XRE family transcriptional regulator
MTDRTAFDPLVFGRRLRHHRTRRNLTLAQLAAMVDRQAPYLSMIENGKREPRLSLVDALAAALEVPTADLLAPEAPDRRSELEIAIERIQDEPRYRSLGLPRLKATAGMPDLVLEHVVTLYEELADRQQTRSPDIAAARRANTELRAEMRDRDNHFPEIEALARTALDAVDYSGTGALPQRLLTDLADHFGFVVERVQDVPASARAVADLRNHRLYIRQRDELRTRSARSVILQTLGHFALGHDDPVDFADFLRQRVEANYFAGAVLMPEETAVAFMAAAKEGRDLAVEDLKEYFYVSYEMAAHRFTNLATVHLDIPVHFVRSDGEGSIWKAYENNGVPFPEADDGGIEGERLCREWGTRQAFHSEDKFAIHYQYTDTPTGTFWCGTHIEADRTPPHAITLGARFEDVRWFRGRDTKRHSVSHCPDGPCCRTASQALARRWHGYAWPSPAIHTNIPKPLPAGTFPGVDLAEVFEFLEEHDREE